MSIHIYILMFLKSTSPVQLLSLLHPPTHYAMLKITTDLSKNGISWTTVCIRNDFIFAFHVAVIIHPYGFNGVNSLPLASGRHARKVTGITNDLPLNPRQCLRTPSTPVETERTEKSMSDGVSLDTDIMRITVRCLSCRISPHDLLSEIVFKARVVELCKGKKQNRILN